MEDVMDLVLNQEVDGYIVENGLKENGVDMAKEKLLVHQQTLYLLIISVHGLMDLMTDTVQKHILMEERMLDNGKDRCGTDMV